MYDVVIFGGTTEGRQLADYCTRTRTKCLTCVATEVGDEQITDSPSVTVHVGKLDREQIIALLRETTPRIVVDATHPFAAQATRNVKDACEEVGAEYLRVSRADTGAARNRSNVLRFSDIAALTSWLNSTTGVVFATTGAKEAEALTSVAQFKDRVVLRILPTVESIESCGALGFPTNHLVAMQGPFSQDLNEAMFQHFDASILVTKDSGDVGGLNDKLKAAEKCHMVSAVISRPDDVQGVLVDEAEDIITQAVMR